MSQRADGAVASDAADAATSVFDRRHRFLTLGVLVSVGSVAFESLGVATVLPDIARGLNGLGAYGWGLSALMLANIIGTVVAGRSADRGGPWRPMAAGLITFAAGCAVAGTAPSWPVFLAGRFVQGLGVGAVMAMAYTTIGLAYPAPLRGRMFALLSSAWTAPSLVGPVVAGLLVHQAGWPMVFLLMLPIIAVATLLTLPALRGLPAVVPPAPAPAVSFWKRPLVAAVQLTVGTGLLLQALLLPDVVPLAVLSVAGLVIALPALRRVTPEGTLTARPGIGAGLVIRALLCGVFFGSEAFLPLGLQELRGLGPAEAGLGLSAGAITWVVGSALQARWDGRAPRSVMAGFALLLAGIVLVALSILTPDVPAYAAVLGWAVGGLGMGVAFNASTTSTLEQTPAHRQGEVSGALQLAQTLATAVIAGLGGAAIAIARHLGGSTGGALLATFTLTALMALVGMALARKLHPAR